MNRLPLLGKDATSSLSSSVQVEMARLSGGTRRGVPHALFAPMHYEPNYAYPLLVWLHGPGDNEQQLQRIMPLVSMRNYVGVGPRGNLPLSNLPFGGRRNGYAWDHSTADLAVAEQHVFDAIDAATVRFHIAPHRIFLGGYQCGGTAALRIALRYPDRFAGVLTLGGGFPENQAPLARLNAARTVPLFIAQGRDSDAYPIEQLCENLRLLHSAGLSLTIRHYPCGDELTSQMLHDMDVWMMEIVTGIPTGPEHPPVTPVDSN
ncbi:MAG: alpha/beta hydrolase [Pirellulaceae bacterium]